MQPIRFKTRQLQKQSPEPKISNDVKDVGKQKGHGTFMSFRSHRMESRSRRALAAPGFVQTLVSSAAQKPKKWQKISSVSGIAVQLDTYKQLVKTACV